MSQVWHELSAVELRTIATSLRSGRISMPASALALEQIVPRDQSERVASAIRAMGVEAAPLAEFLELLAEERSRVEMAERAVELVWTGPGAGNVPGRDTGSVVRELFGSAKQTVLVAGYAIHRGREVFAVLGQRMSDSPGLRVTLVLDVPRRSGDTTVDADLIYHFAREFREKHWPSERLPDIYFDPRSLHMDSTKRSAMHAKCIVVDRVAALITSANFTTAAQTKNIEVGVLARSPALAESLARNFEALIAAAALRRLPT